MRPRVKRPTGGAPPLRPGNWPVRWRLATTSAGLTLIILLAFGGVIGKVATNRIRDDFNGEVKSAAQTLAAEIHINYTPIGGVAAGGPNLDDFVRPNAASVRVFDAGGHQIGDSAGAAPMGPGESGPPPTRASGWRPPKSATKRQPAGYVQYGRSLAHVNSTIDRLWLFIAAGVLAGTLLASLAGLAIAGRAMRPVSSLTATARKIADTGDPSRHMPEPDADDEVGELAGTLEQMLRSSTRPAPSARRR